MRSWAGDVTRLQRHGIIKRLHREKGCRVIGDWFQEMRPLQVRGIDRHGTIGSIKGFQREGNIEAREIGLMKSWGGGGAIRQ